MSATGTAGKDRDTGALVVYSSFLGVWVVACILFGIFLFTTLWLLVPFIAGLAWIIYVGWRAYSRPMKLGLGGKDEREKEARERSLFEWILKYIGNIILAITIVLLVAVATWESTIDVPSTDLLASFIYGFSALGVAALCILPFPWLTDVAETRVIRHLKTAAHLFVVSLFFCSVIALAVGIFRALYLG